MTLSSVLKNVSRVAAALAMAYACAAHADATFPTKPVTIVVPFAAGGTTDVIARALQNPLQKILGQPVVIENKTGASGLIATKHVLASPPDGHTILIPNNGFLLSPLVSKDGDYDPVKSFAPIALVSKQPLLLVVHPSVPANNLEELIAYAKARPKAVEFASSGPLSITQMFTELFAQRAGIEVLHVPYRGQAPSLMAVLSGEAKALLNVTSAQMNGFIQNKQVRLLGVSSSEPTPLAPGAPPIASVLPGFSGEVWFGLFAPAGTPKAAVNKLNDAVNQALAQPDVRERILAAGSQTIGGSPEHLLRLVEDEFASWRQVVRKANITPQ